MQDNCPAQLVLAKARRKNQLQSKENHNVTVQRQALFRLLHISDSPKGPDALLLLKSLQSTCLTATQLSSLLRSDLGSRTGYRDPEICPIGAGPPPSEPPRPGSCSQAGCGPLPAAPAPHIHRHVPAAPRGRREPQARGGAAAASEPAPPPPRGLSPRPPPRSGEAAGPRGPEGRARSVVRAESLLHMEPAPGGMAGAWNVAADRGLSAPLGTSRRRGPEARAKLGWKGGSRGPGAARGRRRGGSGDSAAGSARLPIVVLIVVVAARRATPERRTQRPHHLRQASPLRAAGPPLHTDP
ncbi:skin secretory protein xP2-like [Felis catus]|uniref:skin secretory protein xP2-like n=1 Tax=Felis catus TaxID=9685 RepID=UPI001D19E2AF|nr:skin secretory protein xP2-like [Felis catus]